MNGLSKELILEGLGEKDSEKIVIDEVGGLLLAFWGLRLDPVLLILGFFIFRILDAIKVYPADKSKRFIIAGTIAKGKNIIIKNRDKIGISANKIKAIGIAADNRRKYCTVSCP